MTFHKVKLFFIYTASLATACIFLSGCNANGWMGDPRATGYYKPTPTTIPILDRIDIIEEQNDWLQLSEVSPADLMPSDLTYKIAPGDVLDVSIYGLYSSGQHFPVQRRVDQGGYFRVPEIGDVLVAGLTPQAAEDIISSELSQKVMSHPSVQVNVLDQTGFTYTVYGGLARWGVFTLRDPNLLLVEALSQAGGIPQTVNNIYVIRQLPVSDDVLPVWNRPEATGNSNQSNPTPVIPTSPVIENNSSTNIEDLINQLDIGLPPSEPVDTVLPVAPAPDEVDVNELIEDITPIEETPSVSPGIIQTGPGQLVDVDDLVPPSTYNTAPVDVDDVTQSSDEMDMTPDSTFIYVQETDSWVPVSTNQTSRVTSKDSKEEGQREIPGMLERIIVIPWERLSKGDSAYNIVVRPDDRIYVEPPPIGNLYIRGEVARPGVFDYPISRDRITLSQFITAAGDLSPIAVPEKVSITRRLSDNLEATVTLNFAAILQKTEPDIYLKPSDHISVGTSWGATPMAIIRNGFRSTYGFGFLLDRNFGNDVFGAPPR